ncbi:MAG: IclR family transcriptional regulator [Nesterenkonia sp.]|nr:IclR family transcriptional regulator [Nesterenkonia sp.]
MANSTSGDSVLSRAVRLLSGFRDHEALTPSELADHAGLPRTTGYRLIAEMSHLGLVTRSEGGFVEPGRLLWEIAQRSHLSRTLRQTALPFMQDVNAVVRHTTQLAVLDDAGVLIVEQLSRQGAAVNPAEVAGTMPVHLTSMGHVLLAFADPDRTESWLSTNRRLVETERPQLREELREARARGFARLSGEINAQTTGLSVPIVDRQGRSEAALTVVVPRDSPQIPQFLMALQTAGHGISRAIGRGT